MARNKSVPVELGGATRTLKLNLNALEAFESTMGVSMTALTEKDANGDPVIRVPVKTLRVMLWAFLLTDEPSLTIHQVGEWVDFDNLREVTEAITKCMTTAVSKQPAEATEKLPLPETQIATTGAN